MSVDRGFTWMDDETVALIDIFSKPEVQEELQGAKRNITVYEKVAQELSDIGFSRTAYQCREKVKRLRKEYQHNKYCILNNTKPKKPMKHFHLVDKIFNRNSPDHSISEINLINSETEDIYPSFNIDRESDASNSFTDNEHIAPDSILPVPSFSELDGDNSHMLLEVKLTNSPLMTQTDSNSTLFLNGEENYDLSEKDSPLDEMDSPWVPNVVLVENGSTNRDIDSLSDNEEKLHNINTLSEKEDIVKDTDEPPQKRKKHNLLKLVLDKVTEKFLNYQEVAESRFLERITHLEQERMKRDENMQKLWIEFEERRRKEEQQHEIKMLSLLGQFVSQMKESGTSNESSNS